MCQRLCTSKIMWCMLWKVHTLLQKAGWISYKTPCCFCECIISPGCICLACYRIKFELFAAEKQSKETCLTWQKGWCQIWWKTNQTVPPSVAAGGVFSTGGYNSKIDMYQKLSRHIWRYHTGVFTEIEKKLYLDCWLIAMSGRSSLRFFTSSFSMCSPIKKILFEVVLLDYSFSLFLFGLFSVVPQLPQLDLSISCSL